MLAVATEPVLRRNRRNTHTTRRTTTNTAATRAESNATTLATAAATAASSSAAALPHAIPCYNYFELFPEEVGATGNVEVRDSAEARMWQLVGRKVSPAVAEKEGGCVKVMLDDVATPEYFNITASDDEVYGRASYLPHVSMSAPAKHVDDLWNFVETGCDACTTECDESNAVSACSSPCGSCASTSVRCVYPVA